MAIVCRLHALVNFRGVEVQFTSQQVGIEFQSRQFDRVYGDGFRWHAHSQRMARAIQNGASLRGQRHNLFLPRPRFFHEFPVMHHLQNNQFSEDGPAPDEDDPGEP
jgi:hypothetical protein